MSLANVVESAALLIIGGLVTWFVQSRIEAIRSIKESLNSQRMTTYIQILDPFFSLFSGTGSDTQHAIKQLTSYKYRKTAFELTLFGADGVVKAYNSMFQYAYKMESGTPDIKETMWLWGHLLLEIRKSLGNKRTSLDEYDMLRAMIKDIDDFKK